MPSPNPSAESRGDPLAPAEQLARWLMGTTIHVLVGLLLGMIAARLIRRGRLHWSWSAAVAAAVLLARGAIGGASLTFGVAALASTLWGRNWHRDDLEAGADLADIAASRRSPIGALRRVANAAALRRRERSGAAGWFRDQRLLLGRDHSGEVVSIPLGDASGGTHAMVVGATGSGKTVTQTWITVRAIEHGLGAVVVDPKGDRRMREEIRAAAGAASRRFVEWTPEGPCVYNPYARGSETEIADKVLAGERYTEPHYLRQAQRYLGHVVRALRSDGQEVALWGIVDHLDPMRLEVLARSLPEAQARGTHDYLDSLTPRQRSDLAGVRDRLAILAESDVGPWLDPRTVAAGRFELLEAVRAKAVVYFSLESDVRPLLVQMLGAAIVQDLQATVAALQGRATPTLVVIDEFSAVAAEQVVRLFGRARSAGLSLLLGTQELSDLRLPGRERLLEQVMGNLSVLIAHRQVVPHSAELIASLAGRRGAWRTSRNSDGKTTRVRSSRPVLDPGEVMTLEQGSAAVIVLSRGASVRITRVFYPERDR